MQRILRADGWVVREPKTDAVLAGPFPYGIAVAWLVEARTMHRNAGHIPPRYHLRRLDE